MKRFAGHLVLGAVLALAGCGEEQDPVAPEPGPTTTRAAAGPSATGGAGSIRGTVSLVGRPPEMRVIENKPCHPGATPIREETVVADADGRLANVVAFLREAPPSADVLPPARLDQVNCRFVPHVLALKTGQVLRVTSSDATLHNVHTLSEANPSRNEGFTKPGATKDMSFAEPEEFTVRCDVQHWMNAKIHVFDHAHFTVTDAAGGFELKDVPAGAYTLVLRHELFGELERPVDVAAGKTVTASATYRKPE